MIKRSLILFVSLLFAFSGIVARVYTLADRGYAEAADVQSAVTVTVATARGTLYDRNLERLTNDRTGYAASVVGVPSALSALSSYYEPEEWEMLHTRLEQGKPVVIANDSVLPLAEGILQFTVPQCHNGSGLASHVIGYLGDDGVHGACGAQYALDELLLANAGSVRVTYQTDGTGRVLPGGEVTVENTLARSGGGAALTLDREIQNMVQVVAGESISRGAVVVMDVDTGDILAQASFPGFDATQLAAYLEAENSPLFDRTTAAYNCGSVFKTVTAMAALERGTPMTQSFPCLGALRVGTNRIKCHHVLGHGTLTLCGGFAQSCNPYFIQLAQLCGGASVYRTASLLSFDSPLLLMDNWQTDRAVLPTEEEFGGSVLLANISIGQGDLLATPVHVTAMTACVAGGGRYYRPNLLYGTVDMLGTMTPIDRDPPSRVCSEQTATALREMMCAVVTDGTGRSAAPTMGTAGGKTGTAQTGWKTADGDTMTHSWFTGFYPAEDPQVAVTVLAEDAGTTGEATAPVFKAICDHLYRMGKIRLPQNPT